MDVSFQTLFLLFLLAIMAWMILGLHSLETKKRKKRGKQNGHEEKKTKKEERSLISDDHAFDLDEVGGKGFFSFLFSSTKTFLLIINNLFLLSPFLPPLSSLSLSSFCEDKTSSLIAVGFEGHTGYATRMGEEEEGRDLYPGTYYLCLEKNGGSVLRMNRPRDNIVNDQVVFVADPRRLCKACHYFEVCLSLFLFSLFLFFLSLFSLFLRIVFFVLCIVLYCIVLYCIVLYCVL